MAAKKPTRMKASRTTSRRKVAKKVAPRAGSKHLAVRTALTGRLSPRRAFRVGKTGE